MPLSEHEQNLLSQMEQQLQVDDPKFASAMRGATIPGGRRLILGILGALVGLALIVLAAAGNILLLAIPGFLLMLGGATYAFSSGRRARGPVGSVAPDGSTRPRNARKTRSSEGLMHRLEQRWDKRRNNGEN